MTTQEKDRLLAWAWELISNVNRGDWNKTTPTEWRESAKLWAEEYFGDNDWGRL